jgi:hypothetical protein
MIIYLNTHAGLEQVIVNMQIELYYLKVFQYYVLCVCS